MALSLTLNKATGTSTVGAKLSIAELTGDVAGSYTEIPGLQEIPELGGDPEQIDVTTLEDTVKRSIPGVQDLGDLAFTFLYDKTNYLALKNGLSTTTTYAWKVTFNDGLEVTFNAIPNIKLSGGGSNAALTFTINMSLQSEITPSDGGKTE